MRFDFIFRLILGCCFGFTISGCTNTVLVSMKNNTATPLKATVIVESETTAKFEQPVSANGEMPQTNAGNYREGKNISLQARLPQGGVLLAATRELQKEPKPFPIHLDVDSIQGEVINLGESANIEKELTNLDNSFVSPTDDATNLVDTSLGSVYYCIDNSNDPVHSKCNRIYDTTQIGAKVTLGELQLTTNPLPPSMKIELVVDKQHAGELAADIPSIAKVKADFTASALYKYKFELIRSGWLVIPKSWSSAYYGLKETEQGKKIIQDLKNRIAHLKQGEHIRYLDSAFFVGRSVVSTYQGQQLTGNMNVDASTVISGGAGFKFTGSSTDTKEFKNLVLRVRYQELYNADISNLVASKGVTDKPILSKPVIRLPS